jgi:hypothetical protein
VEPSGEKERETERERESMYTHTISLLFSFNKTLKLEQGIAETLSLE